MSNNTKTNTAKRQPGINTEYLSSRIAVWGAREVFNAAQRRLRTATRKSHKLEERLFGSGAARMKKR